jgi:hypothetical protein
MGNEGAVLSGMKEAPEKFTDTIRMYPFLMRFADQIAGMLKVVEEATKETTSGKMINWYVDCSFTWWISGWKIGTKIVS